MSCVAMPENKAMVSSGSSSKNEAGIVNVPLARPIWRFVATLLIIGRISAIGLFLLQRIKLSPFATSLR